MELYREMITFEEHVCTDDGLRDIYYFVIEKDLLDDLVQHDYETAVQGCLCVILNAAGEMIECRVSPTEYDESEDSFIDFDWTDIDITEAELQMLMEIAGRIR